MNQGNRVEIMDRDGWCKEFPLDKPLLHIGSDARNDIVLDVRRGAGVAARHLQLIAMPGDQPVYRAINLADADILLGEAGDRSLEPRSATEIADTEWLRLGEFTLTFYLAAAGREALPAVPARERIPAETRVAPATQQRPVAPIPAATPHRTAASIGLRLSLPQTAVDPESPLEGTITVHNLGNEPGVQFRLELEGLEPDWYEMGSGPILFPNVEKDVVLRIHHPRGPGILAGQREITVCCTAPEAYPGESITVSQVLEILPFYHHELRLTPVV